MGNSESCGFGVLNSTQHKLTVSLAMGPTHYWEENVMPGKVFYRWPGAVFYTVRVFPTLGIKLNRRTACSIFAVDRSGFHIPGVDFPTACTLVAVNSLRDAGIVLDHNTQIALLESYQITKSNTYEEFESRLDNLKKDIVQVFKDSQLRNCKRFRYGGGHGSWLEITGLPEAYKTDDGRVAYRSADINIQVKCYKEIMERGEFTDESDEHYHTRHYDRFEVD